MRQPQCFMLKNQNTLLPCESLGSCATAPTSFSRTNTPWNLTLFPLDDIRFQLMQDYHHIIASTCLYSRIQSLFCVHGNRYKNNEIIHYYPLASHQRKIVFTRICYKVKIPLFGWRVELISPGCLVKDVGVVVIVESTGNIVVTSGPIKRKMQRYNNIAPHCLNSNRFIKSRTRLVKFPNAL